MSVQTTYGDLPVAVAGQIADLNPKDIGSFIAEVDINFGYPCVRGTADNEVKLPTATGDTFVGVACYTNASYSTNENGYAATEVLSVLRSAYVWVKVNVAVAVADPVFFIHTGDVGQFRNDADTDKADAITGATFETAAALGGIALIRLP